MTPARITVVPTGTVTVASAVGAITACNSPVERPAAGSTLVGENPYDPPTTDVKEHVMRALETCALGDVRMEER